MGLPIPQGPPTQKAGGPFPRPKARMGVGVGREWLGGGGPVLKVRPGPLKSRGPQSLQALGRALSGEVLESNEFGWKARPFPCRVPRRVGLAALPRRHLEASIKWQYCVVVSK